MTVELHHNFKTRYINSLLHDWNTCTIQGHLLRREEDRQMSNGVSSALPAMAASNKDSTPQVNISYNLLNEGMYLFKGLLRLNSLLRNAFAAIFLLLHIICYYHSWFERLCSYLHYSFYTTFFILFEQLNSILFINVTFFW